MSNVNAVVELVKTHPMLAKKDLVRLVMETLNIKQANARTTIFNALRKLDAPIAAKATVETVAEAFEELVESKAKKVKEKNLETIKAVAKKGAKKVK